MSSGNAIFDLQASIKRNAEDLREEMVELERWEAEMKAKSAQKKVTPSRAPGSSNSIVADDANLPPIRGTAPMVKPKVEPKPDPTVTYKDEGNEHYRLNHFDDAIRSYTKGINIDPNNSSAHILYANRAMCYLKLQQWAEAEKDATTCVGMNRSYFKAFYRRALARKALNKLEEAVSDLQTVLVLSPGDADSTKELKICNELLAKKRAEEKAAAEKAGVAKKKLVIEEVDDDEDDAVAEAEAQKLRAQALEKKRLEEAEAARLAQAKADADRIQADKARRAREHEIAAANAQRQLKSNPKIEEIDDADSPSKQKAPAKAKVEPTIAPRKLETKISIDAIPVPKSFTEFEKTFNEIGKDAELFTQYAKKLNLDALPGLMGSSMTSDMLLAFMNVVIKDSDRAFATKLVQAISGARRLDELLMFLEDSEKLIVSKAVASVNVDSKVKQRFL